MINKRLVNFSVFFFAAFSVIFTIFSDLDLYISALFFAKGAGFIYKNNIFVTIIYDSIPILTKIFISGCFIYLVFLFLKSKNYRKIISSWVFFLLISAIISPGILVNYALKDHFGRARPREIIEFEGRKSFTRAFVISQQCGSNCSFSSGHAAMAFYFTALAYIVNQFYFSRVYIAGIIWGLLVGFSRIIMGGHFASDVFMSGFIVLSVNHLIFLFWKRNAK